MFKINHWKVVVMTFKCSQAESGLTVFLESLIILSTCISSRTKKNFDYLVGELDYSTYLRFPNKLKLRVKS